MGEQLTRYPQCGFCKERRSQSVCINCCDKTSEDIHKLIRIIVDRQRLQIIRFNEVLRVLGNRLASRKALEMYLIDEDF